MSKKGTYSNVFFSNFAARIHGTPIRFGILIGTPSVDGQRDVVFAAPTVPHPSPPAVEGQDAKAASRPRDAAALLKSTVGGRPFSYWAREHMSQLSRLLAGGLEACGCFAVVSDAGARDIAPLLVPILKDVVDPLVLTIDGSTRKLTFWQHVGGAKPALRPAQVKADPHRDALLLWSAVPIDIVLPNADLSDIRDMGSLLGHVESAVMAALDRSIVGFATKGDSPLEVVDSGSERTVSEVVPKDCKELACTFLYSGTLLAAVANPEGHPLVRQRSLVVATALLLRRGLELRHAAALLQKEIVASAVDRVRLALGEVGRGGEAPACPRESKLQLPWRALCCLDDADVQLWCAEYCQPDEGFDVAFARLGQVLGLPEDAFQEPPAHLNERLRLERDFEGTYAPEPPPTMDQPPAAPDQKNVTIVDTPPASKLASPNAACVALVALAAAIAIPALLR